MGHGAGHPGQPGHRLRPDRAVGRDPGCGAVQRVHGGQPAAEPGRRAGAGGDVHRDLRAGARARRTGRRRRRRGVRAAPGDTGDHRAAGHHAAVGGRRAPAGAADVGPQPAGERAADHRVRLPAVAAGDLLRPVVGVHGNPQHPQRVRAAGLGAGGQQRRRDRHPGRLPGRTGPAVGRPGADGQRQAAGAGHRHHAGGVRADRGAAGRHPAPADQPSPAVGNRRPAQALRHDGRRDGVLRADQPDRSDRHQPNRQHRSRFRPGDLQLHLAGADAAVRHDRRHRADGGHAAAEPQRRRRRHRRGARRPVAGHPADDDHADPDGGVHDRRRVGDGQRAVRLRTFRRRRRRPPGCGDRDVGVHPAPLRRRAAAAAGLLRPPAAVDTDRDHRGHHDRQDRRFAGRAAPHRQPRPRRGLSGVGQRPGIRGRRDRRLLLAPQCAAAPRRPPARRRGGADHPGHGHRVAAGRSGRVSGGRADGHAAAHRLRRRRRLIAAAVRARGDHGADRGGGHAARAGARGRRGAGGVPRLDRRDTGPRESRTAAPARVPPVGAPAPPSSRSASVVAPQPEGGDQLLRSGIVTYPEHRNSSAGAGASGTGIPPARVSNATNRGGDWGEDRE